MIQKLRGNNQKGFTLIELMIVVAIIGILAAIAIPNFLKYQLKSKTAEAKTNLGAIKTCEVAYKAEMDGYCSVAICPRAVGALTSSKVAWVTVPAANLAVGGGAGSFEDIGFEPAGHIYYAYSVAIGLDSAGNVNQEYTADAVADLDGDGAALATAGQFGLTSSLLPALVGAVTGKQPAAPGAVEDLNRGVF